MFNGRHASGIHNKDWRVKRAHQLSVSDVENLTAPPFERTRTQAAASTEVSGAGKGNVRNAVGTVHTYTCTRLFTRLISSGFIRVSWEETNTGLFKCS